MTGLETSEILGREGHHVTLVEMMGEIGPGLFSVIRNDILKRLSEYNVDYLSGHKLTSISERCVDLEKVEDGSHVTVEADFVVLSLGVAPDKDLVNAYRERSEHVFVIGDAERGGRIAQATRSALDKAYSYMQDE